VHPLGCEEEMHNAWWSFVGIIKLGTLVVSEPKLKAPRPKLLPKHYMITFLKVQFLILNHLKVDFNNFALELN
jgi:hypothetical protein